MEKFFVIKLSCVSCNENRDMSIYKCWMVIMEILYLVSMIFVMKRSDEVLYVLCLEFGEFDLLVGREEGIWVIDVWGKVFFLGLGWGEVIDVCSGVSCGVIDFCVEFIFCMICFGEVCVFCDFGCVVLFFVWILNFFWDLLYSRGGCL